MTVLETCKSAARLLSMAVPSTVFSGTDSFGAELGEIANEAALAMLQDYDWRKVTALATVTGNGVDLDFPLPDDYSRMPKEGSIVRQNSMRSRLRRYDNLDDWLYAEQSGLVTAYGRWIILGNRLHMSPAQLAAEPLVYYYITNQIGTRSSVPITSFATDNDVFILDERLLKLDIVWRYKAAKGWDYAEDMRNAEKAKDQANGREKGPTMIAIGTPRMRIDADIAYPGVLG